MMSIEYHKRELEIAMDKSDHRNVLPKISDSDKVILDIGCGIGQSFVAMDCLDRTCIGIDIDKDAISYGIKKYGDDIQFILADAKQIPMPSNMFDFVFSRVSLPYTNIPRVIEEVKRVLKKNGRIWMTLHGRNVAIEYLKEAIRSRSIKDFVHVLYIFVNVLCLKYFSFLFPFLSGSYESWQDTNAMEKLLTREGFEVRISKTKYHMVIHGTLK